MKKSLITGVTGMLGSHLADHLLKNTNWKIFGTIRWRSNLENINHLLSLVNNIQIAKLKKNNTKIY